MGFLSTYRKIKGVWKRPKFNVFVGLWKNDHSMLPVSRGGYIRLAKFHQCYEVKKYVYIEDKTSTCFTPDGKPIKRYKTIYHDIKPDYAWNRNIRKKLRKFGLGWIPPIIITPWWLKVAVYNWDVVWKTKYDDIRYEFPPQFTIVFFGLCLTITLHEPTGNEYTCDDQYWEGILNWLYKYNKDMYRTTYEGGIWTSGNIAWFSIRPEHIVNEKDYEQYCQATYDLKKENKRKDIF